MNKLTMQGDWDITKAKLKQKYAKLTDNDLHFEEGKVEELIGRIEKACGARRDEIERYLNGEGK